MSDLIKEAESRQHAPLSASGSKIWLNCTGSYRLTKNLPDSSSIYAEEGTRAHAFCEYLLQKYVLHTDPEPVIPDDSEMEQCGEAYLTYIQGIVEYGRRNGIPCHVYAETRVDFSNVVPYGFGTCDCLITLGEKLIVVDFKYGKGVRVDSWHNSQMQLYALGALHELELISNTFSEIEMTIFQPRIDNISTWRISMSELAKFAKYANDQADENLSEKGTCKAGEWCRFCKANPLCKERAKIPLRTIRKILALGGEK